MLCLVNNGETEMPTNTLAYLLASRARSMAWHVKNDKSNGVVPHPKEPRSPYRRHVDETEQLCKEFMPSGSGFDSGTRFIFDGSKPSRLIFTTSFHHMNDVGMYDGWTEHRVTVIAEHDGMEIVVGGKDRNKIKDYIAETFQQALSQRIISKWHNDRQEMEFILER